MRIERRAHPRIEAQETGKIYDPRSRKYFPCATCNVSRGGAFVMIRGRLPVVPGDRVLLGVASGPRRPILRSFEMMEVEVVRTLTTTDRRQGIGVQFVHADDVALNLTRLAA